jgi:hypothetical protein
MAAHGYGYIPDDHDKALDLPIRALLGARASDPGDVSLEPYIAQLRNQGQTGSCTGFAFGLGVMVRCAVLGTPIAWPSPAALYAGGRAVERADRGLTAEEEPLADKGAKPNCVVRAARDIGIPRDDQWPVGGFDPEKINDEPTLGELEDASLFELQEYYRIDSVGEGRAADVRHALASGYPLVVGTQVDRAFEDYGGRGLLTSPDPRSLSGGHMVCLVGCRSDGTYRWANSWGTGWGDSGMFTTDEAFLLSGFVSDIYAIQVAAR